MLRDAAKSLETVRRALAMHGLAASSAAHANFVIGDVPARAAIAGHPHIDAANSARSLLFDLIVKRYMRAVDKLAGWRGS